MDKYAPVIDDEVLRRLDNFEQERDTFREAGITDGTQDCASSAGSEESATYTDQD